MTLPRVLHRIYARCAGYFWKPCPICKREFGGHEASFVLWFVSEGNSEVVCATCEHEVRRRNAKRFTAKEFEDVSRVFRGVRDKAMGERP